MKIPLPPAAPEILESLALPFGAIADDRPGNFLEMPIESPWLDPRDLEDFLRVFYPSNLGYPIRVQKIPELGVGRIVCEYSSYYSQKAINPLHNTSEKLAFDLIDEILQGKPSEVRWRRFLNRSKTRAAIAARETIQRDFRDWLWSDRDRCQKYLDLYWQKIQYLQKSPDRPTICLDGLAIAPRDLQIEAAAKICTENCLISADPGTGKTLAAALALRQGHHKKVIFVTKASLVSSTLAEFRKVYPDFQGMVIAPSVLGDRDRVKDALTAFGRRKSGVAFLNHETFRDCILPSPIAERQILEEELSLVLSILQGDEDFMESAANVYPSKWKLIKNLKRRATTLSDEIKACDRRSIPTRSLTRLGVTMVIADEADVYKNLPTRSLRPIQGISISASNTAKDMLLKAIELEQINGRLVFMTGSWPDNSISELWAAATYLDRHRLRAIGLPTFDAWLSAFGQVSQSLEIGIDGKAKVCWRIREFCNFHLLLALKRFALFGTVPDTSDRPRVHQVVIPCPQDDDQRDFLDRLSRI
jgi:N12 class adenine-specific DNA methylase